MLFLIILSILFLDRLSKFIITENLSLNQSVAVIKNVFHLTLVHNRGAAFGILKNYNYLFVFTATLAVILILLNLKYKKDKTYKFALALILGGAVGNLVDRILFGYVIDFLDFRIWPVFNFADSSITVGAILLGYALLVSDKRKA